MTLPDEGVGEMMVQPSESGVDILIKSRSGEFLGTLHLTPPLAAQFAGMLMAAVGGSAAAAHTLEADEQRERARKRHNKKAIEIVRDIVMSAREDEGTLTDLLVLLESVVVGVLMATIRLGAEPIALDRLMKGARSRLAGTLRDVETKGNA